MSRVETLLLCIVCNGLLDCHGVDLEKEQEQVARASEELAVQSLARRFQQHTAALSRMKCEILDFHTLSFGITVNPRSLFLSSSSGVAEHAHAHLSMVRSRQTGPYGLARLPALTNSRLPMHGHRGCFWFTSADPLFLEAAHGLNSLGRSSSEPSDISPSLSSFLSREC